MGDRNDHMFAPAKVDLLNRLSAEDEAVKALDRERIAAQKQALIAEAYRQMPADMRQRAKEWGVSALMEAVWLNGWDCGYRQSIRDATAISGPPAPVSILVGSGLSISELQRAHVERQEEWCPDQKPDLSFRGNELGGECGEAQNVIKKLERERHGWRGSRDTVEHLAEELGDVIHCAILCAITAGIDLEPAVIAKFNSTSEKNGLSTMLIAALSAPEAEG
jgi:NTP pyrophosphatase (non-canonical NTP hydrolase)